MSESIGHQVAELVEAARPTPDLPPRRRQQMLAMVESASRQQRRTWARRAPAIAVACALCVIGVGYAFLSRGEGPRVGIAQLPASEAGSDVVAGSGLEVAADPMVAPDPMVGGYGWSPDGSWIIYPAAKEAEKLHGVLLWRLAADAKTRELLTEETRPWVYNPQVTRDGKHAVYFDGKRLDVLAIADRTATTVPDSSGGYYATCSPDGQWVAFARRYVTGRGDGARAVQSDGLWKWPLAGGGKPVQIVTLPARLKTLDDGELRTPCWSPDGRWIAYVLTKTNRRGEEVSSYTDDIYVVRPDGSGLHKVISLRTAPEAEPVRLGTQCWSPDSKRLAFVWTEAGGRSRWPWGRSSRVRGVMALDIATGKLTAVVPPRAIGSHAEFTSDPSWSPKSDHIAFSAAPRRRGESGPRSDIYVASARTGALTRIAAATEETSDLRPLWSPQGTSLLYARYQVQTTGYVYAQQKQELWVVAVRKAAGAEPTQRQG
jgi:Tol biopolymer transport system component